MSIPVEHKYYPLARTLEEEVDSGDFGGCDSAALYIFPDRDGSTVISRSNREAAAS
jgi:hypothetical protein